MDYNSECPALAGEKEIVVEDIAQNVEVKFAKQEEIEEDFPVNTVNKKTENRKSYTKILGSDYKDIKVNLEALFKHTQYLK